MPRICRQYVLEYVPLEGIPDSAVASFQTHRHQNTKTPMVERTSQAQLGVIWHQRLGHPSSEALERLVGDEVGIRVKGPSTVQCDQCGQAKVKRRVNRAERHRGQRRVERIAMDIHDLRGGYEGSVALLLFTDRYSGLMWDYYLSNKSAESLLECITHLSAFLDRQYGEQIKVFECDNEFPRATIIREWMQRNGYGIEASAPYTQAQNGGAERSGGVIKDKARAMAGRLPKELWPEIYRAAVYLWNRTPRYMYDWKSPYEMFFKARPTLTHLRVYGCKAFALTTDAMAKRNRLDRLSPRAWIGYLVGYASTNQFRIWLPTRNKVIVTRDVHFNEECIFDGKLETLRENVRVMEPGLLAEVLRESARGDVEGHHQAITHTLEEEEDEAFWSDIEEQEEEVVPQGVDSCGGQYTTARFDFLPTPPETPPASLLAAAFRGSKDTTDRCSDNRNQEELSAGRSECQPWEYAFHAAARRNVVMHVGGMPRDRVENERLQRQGTRNNLRPSHSTKYLTRKQADSRFWKGEGIHINELEPPPEYRSGVEHHPMRDAFLAAERSHLASHNKMGSWSTVRKALIPEGSQILDCMWVYAYKFDKAGWLVKCKARLVVRGDQQKRTNGADTYAATLAGRSFKALLAIAAKFDLELHQYDAVNAFVHAKLDEVVYMRMPPGYQEKGMVLILHKALYGLRKSPLLWQRDFRTSLERLGFNTIPHEACCMSKDQVLVFFYVDDIVFAFLTERSRMVEAIVAELKKRYELTGGGNLQWFLGMEIIRDRRRGYAALTQRVHLERLRRDYGINTSPTTPMTQEELLPYDGTATK